MYAMFRKWVKLKHTFYGREQQNVTPERQVRNRLWKVSMPFWSGRFYTYEIQTQINYGLIFKEKYIKYSMYNTL